MHNPKNLTYNIYLDTRYLFTLSLKTWYGTWSSCTLVMMIISKVYLLHISSSPLRLDSCYLLYIRERIIL